MLFKEAQAFGCRLLLVGCELDSEAYRFAHRRRSRTCSAGHRRLTLNHDQPKAILFHSVFDPFEEQRLRFALFRRFIIVIVGVVSDQNKGRLPVQQAFQLTIPVIHLIDRGRLVLVVTQEDKGKTGIIQEHRLVPFVARPRGNN